MKVLHINSYFNGSKFYKNLYDQQKKEGIEIDVFVPTPEPIENGGAFGDYTTLSHNHTKLDRLFFKRKHSKILKDIHKKYDIASFDIMHAHSLFSNGYIAMKLKEKYGIPYIVAVRNTDVFTFFKLMPHLRSLGRQIINEAEQVIFLSKPYRELVIDKYILVKDQTEVKAKSLIIPNGLDEFWLEHRYKQKKTINPNTLKLLYVGVINKNKNILASVEAIEILKAEGITASLTVVGKIVDMEILNQLKKNSNVFVYPPVNMEELLEVYREHDIFVMPSHKETFGLVYAEAMSQGLPVL